MVIQILQLALWLLVFPLVAGDLFQSLFRGEKFQMLWRFVCGQALLWALFQVPCSVCILSGETLTRTAWIYGGGVGLLLAASIFFRVRSLRRVRPDIKLLKSGRRQQPAVWILCGIAALLFGFQLVQTVRMAYADGDDSFYVAETTAAAFSDRMYQFLPYTGSTTGLDIRHGLAPFPVWIAFLARVSGMHPAIVSHIAVPLVMISITYAIYSLIGIRLFAGRRKQFLLFLIGVQLLVLFGDTSIYTVENFMLARSRQGKAALGSIVIPFLFLIFYRLYELLEEEKKISPGWWALLAVVLTAGCLCSTLGSVLTAMLVAVAGCAGAVSYRRFRLLIPMALCCIPCMVYAVLYLVI